jgi:hypothetical protein
VTYLDYVVFFQKLDSASKFSPGATRLYLKLLYVANLIADGGPWPAQFAKSNPEMVGLCGGVANSLRGYRDELEERGLIATTPGGKGPNAVTIYRLISCKKGANNEPLKGANSGPLSAKEGANNEPLTGQNEAKGADKGAGKHSNFEPPIIRREEEEDKGAAAAASLAPTAGRKSSAKSPKKSGAAPEEIAALELPHPGEEFARLWAMFLTSPKQSGKSLNAHRMGLLKLGRKPEAFALVMLEAAIQGDWVGVENPGTARAYAEWLAQQAQQATAPPAQAMPAEEINPEVIAQQEAARNAQRAAKRAQYTNA